MSRLHRLLHETRKWWPRRASGLPPGQRALDAFPRFADNPLRPPPDVPEHPVLRLAAPGGEEVRFAIDELRACGLVESRTSDFHCVTTWTARRKIWTGIPLAAWWHTFVAPSFAESGEFAVVTGDDGYQAVFLADDLFADDVMLAWELDHVMLDMRHGYPLRLVSPSQYGYKSVKHVTAIELCIDRPASRLGSKEHQRARVAVEERHSRLHGRLLRWPYRLLVPVTAMVAERTLHRHGQVPGPDADPDK